MAENQEHDTPTSDPGGAIQRGSRSSSRSDPEELFERSRHPSPAVAKEWARDGAVANTTHGLPSAPGNPKQHDETDPTGQSHSDTAFTTDGSLTQGGGHTARPGQS